MHILTRGGSEAFFLISKGVHLNEIMDFNRYPDRKINIDKCVGVYEYSRMYFLVLSIERAVGQ